MEQLEANFTLHHLPAEGRDAFLAEVGPRIRGVAMGGHAKVDGAFMGKLPKLEIVANFGVGYDSVDAKWAGEHKIVVTNTPDVLTEEVADTALGLLLMTARDLSRSERYLRAGLWEKQGPFPLSTSTLRDKTVGILALGRIGKAIATRCEAFGLKIVYHGRSPQKDVPYRYYASLVEMAKDVDILISVAPGGPDTFHIVDAEVLRALGPAGILVNIGRGSVVDEGALISALQNKVIHSAGLDVFEHEPHVPSELMAMDHVVLLPHVGSGSVHTRRLMGQLMVDNLTSWFAGKGPLTPVSETPWPR
ncbi:2-hydroxyacid dehydrogenase [Alsobacter sp. SYSU M60028]|uniref:2-hydroxyacid dehydrogenase n=2 Tax=Alsobacter ponti TaxID=2962936 RepID=A0ABT1LEQ2_9HYPH|nr:2-hydroxyacid dehydrogenase [Alsobacter ponti]